MGGGFKYQSLARSKREIRLLELFPRSHKLSKIRPTCRVFTRSLDDNPPFLALSYVWGDANDTRVILVNRQPFKVTRNLYDALMSIAEDDDSIIVWIDAICINQADDEEKGWQVGMMGDIYRQTSGVLAWLGPAADNSDSVIDHLQIVGKQAEECGLHIGLDSTIQAWHAIKQTRISPHAYNSDRVVAEHVLDGRTILVTMRQLEKVLNPIKETVDQNVLFMTDLTNLFRRSWWERIWCLQEITLPKTAYFACGSKRISRRRLRASYYAYWHLCYVALQETTVQRFDFHFTFGRSLQVFTMLSLSRTYCAAKLPLMVLLRTICGRNKHLHHISDHLSFKSTDPRDKIFALLAIARDREELEKLGLSSDYKSSIRRVYMRATITLLLQGYALVLSLCRASPMPSYLPSWVPDWSQPMVNTLQYTIADSLSELRFSASKGKGLRLMVNLSMGEVDIEGISVLGNIYDMVFTVGNVPRDARTGQCIRPHDWIVEVLRLSYETRKHYGDYSERLRAVARTSHADTQYGKDDLPERAGDETFLRALNFLSEDTTNMVSPEIAKPLQAYLAHGDVKRMLEGLSEELHKADRLIWRITPDLCPFVTTRGHLGLGCSDTRQGDVVALIGGTQVPFILRPERNGNFTIVSEAYVDGIMDGEAVETGEWRMINLV